MMSFDWTSPDAADEELSQLVEQYLCALERDAAPDQASFIAEHPHLAARLKDCLEGLQLLREGASQIASSPSQVRLPQIDGYKITREIGRGGMAIVYEAEQLKLQRQVALKVLPLTTMLDQRQLQRFRNEALITAQLDHPNIVSIHDVGVDQGTHYIAMHLVDGRSLAEILAELRRAAGSLESGEFDTSKLKAPIEAASLATAEGDRDETRGSSTPNSYTSSIAHIGRQAAEALQYAHQLGIVHRDVKPSNLLLDRFGVVRVADFGLAHLHTLPELTLSGDIVGTLRYMSPEQALGRRDSVDARSDVYALGATLYELLTLRPMVDGANREEMLRAISTARPAQPGRLNRNVPADLETIVLKATEHEPSDRYASAGEMAADLNRFLAAKPIRARRPGIVDRIRKWTWRNRQLILPLLATLCLGLFASITASAMFFRQKVRAESAADQLREALVSSKINEAKASSLSSETGRRVNGLTMIREAVEVAGDKLTEEQRFQLRNAAIDCYSLIDVTSEFAWWPVERLPESGVAFSKDATRSAWLVSDHELAWAEIKDQRVVEHERIAIQDARRIYNVMPKNRLVVIERSNPSRITLLDLEKGEIVMECSAHQDTFVAFDRQSRRLMFIADKQQLALFDLGTKTKEYFKLDFEPFNFAFSPDGNSVVISEFRNGTHVRLFDLRSGQILKEYGPHPNQVWRVACHPTKSIMATGSGDEVYLWPLDGEGEPYVLRGHEAIVSEVLFSPDGNLLMTAAWDGSSRLWDTRTRRTVVRFSYTQDPQFSENSSHLMTAGGPNTGHQLGIWRIHGQDAMTILDPPGLASDMNLHVNFDSLSRLIATTSSTGVRLWDVVNRRQLCHLPLSDDPVMPNIASSVFSADGAIYTSTNQGLFRWPIAGGTVGPPKRLSGKGSAYHRCQISADGSKLVAVNVNYRAEVYDLPEGQLRCRTGEHHDMRDIAIDPDARFVATGAFRGSGVSVWDAQTGRLVRRLHKQEPHLSATFSGDGSLLFVPSSGRGLTVWSTENWQTIKNLPFMVPRPARRSSYLPVSSCYERTRCGLLDATQGTVVLTYNCLTRPIWLDLAPNENLLVTALRGGITQINDLDYLHRELEKLGLAWSRSGVEKVIAKQPLPERFQVYLGELSHLLPKTDADFQATTFASSR